MAVMASVCVSAIAETEFSIVKDTPSFLLIFSSARIDQAIQLTTHKEKAFSKEGEINSS